MLSSLSNRYLKLFSIFSFSLMIFSLPLITLAQYQLLEPSLIDHYSQSLNLIDYLKFIYRTVLMVVVVISILMVAIGGVEYIFSQVPGAKVEGKQRITNAIIGLLIGLSSYLILYTIDPSFVKFNLTNLKPVQINATGTTPDDGPGTPGGGQPGGPWGGQPNNPNYTGPQGHYGPIPDNEFEVRKRIQDATGNKVTFNDSGYKGRDCKEGNETDCRTYVGGLNEQQITGIIDLANNCNCELMVSGAAEPGGHRGVSHTQGRAVDILRNPILDNHIQSTGQPGGDTDPSTPREGFGNGPAWLIGGSRFDREDSVHWHIMF